MKKEQRFSKVGFLISAFGSSIGLGSIWRFPTIMAQSGGGAFLIPFLISMVICGIPILMLELNVGNKFRKVQVSLFEGMYGKKGRFFGYFYPTLAFLVAAFYSIIIGWVLIQIIISFTDNLFADNYLFGQILKVPDSLGQASDLGHPSAWLVLAMVFIFGLVIVASMLGLKSGIEKINKIFIPLLFIILITLMSYCMSLDGATIGLNKMWEPDWSQLALPKVWTNAFSQAFFSLSIAMGTMMYFSSKTANPQDNNNSAFVVALPLILISLIAGMMNFSALGFLAKHDPEGRTIDEIIGKTPDPGLIFNIFPQVFKQISIQAGPVMSKTLAILFYLCLFSAGTMTLIALCEVTSGNILVKTKMNRKANALIWIGFLFIGAFIYMFNGGKFLINGIDIWVNNIWLFTMAIIEISLIIFTIKNRRLKISSRWNEVLIFSSENSWIKVGKKFTILLFASIALLFVILAFKFQHFFHIILTEKDALIPYVFFGIPMGLGAQILIPTILTFKQEIINFLKFKKNKKAVKIDRIDV